ncbi:MAG: carbohydrate porin [Gammaproteobacteria bacterium]
MKSAHICLTAIWSCIALLLATEVALGEAADTSTGIVFNAVYTGEPIRNLDGGQRTGGTYIDNLDLQIEAAPGSIFGISGLSGLLYVLNNNSAEFSAEYVGDMHIVSSIDAPRGLRLFEAWLDWASANNGFSARFGLYDLNSEFDAVDTASLFVNGAHGMGTDLGQTGLNGPSIFPVSSLSLRLRTGFGSGAYAQLAILDGVPGDPDDPGSNEIDLSSEDGALIVGELGYVRGDWRKLALGAWTYTADFDRLTNPGGPQDDGNNGWYALADRYLWRGEGSGVERSVAGWLRVGQADQRFNPIQTSIGTGVTVAGLINSRPDDEFGLAFAIGVTGDDYRDARQQDGLATDRHETNVELTYSAKITDWLTLQPDIQYIINPGTNPELDNALVVVLRFELNFSTPL